MPKSFLARFHRLLWDLRERGRGGGEVIGAWETIELHSLSWLAPCRKWWKIYVQWEKVEEEAVVEGKAAGGKAVGGKANDLAVPMAVSTAVSTAVSKSKAEVLPSAAAPEGGGGGGKKLFKEER